jgi:hypothetical protein
MRDYRSTCRSTEERGGVRGGREVGIFICFSFALTFPALIFPKPAMLNYGLRSPSLRLSPAQVFQRPDSPK